MSIVLGSDLANRIITADCLAVLRELPPGSIDLTVFSPPYDQLRSYQGNWSLDAPALGDELLRVSREGAMAAVVLGDASRDFAKSLTTFRWAVDWVDRAGWRLYECCIYARAGRPGPWWRHRFRVDHEYVLLFLKGSRPRVFHKEALMVPTKYAGLPYRPSVRHRDGSLTRHQPGRKPLLVRSRKCRGTIWPYAGSSSEGNRIKLQHPATFPDKLAGDLIRCFSNPGDLVLDPMCGSGTTPVMAARHGRRYLGIDVGAAYTAIARKRLKAERELPQDEGTK